MAKKDSLTWSWLALVLHDMPESAMFIDRLVNGMYSEREALAVCTDYTNTGTYERIAIYVAAIIYQALLHRTSCDEERSFEFRVGFSRYIRRICVPKYRVTSESNLIVTPSFRHSSPHLSRYLLWPWVKRHSGCLPRAWRSPSIIEVGMFRRQRESKDARKLTRTWTSECGVRL